MTPSLHSVLTLSQADHTSQRCSSWTTGENKSHIMRKLRTVLSNHCLAVDHQRKRTISGDVVGRGGQTFTICGNFGLICGVYVVPDTALSWVKKAKAEVIERHESAGAELPQSLYTDCACCSGKAGCPETTSTDTSTSVAALWRTIFSVKLDAMHLMVRIAREMNAEHPRRKKFLVDLSHTIFVQHEGDRKELMKAREAARLEGPPTRARRVKFVRRVVGESESVAKRMISSSSRDRFTVSFTSGSSWPGSGQTNCC